MLLLERQSREEAWMEAAIFYTTLGLFSEKVAQVADLSLVLAVLTVVLWPWLGSVICDKIMKTGILPPKNVNMKK